MAIIMWLRSIARLICRHKRTFMVGLVLTLALIKLTEERNKTLELNYLKHLRSLDQADPILIQYATRYLMPPSTLTYKRGSVGIPDSFNALVANIFRNKTNGCFIEAKPYNGVILWHTQYLEEYLNWTGLLIECNPILIPELKSRHRKAWIADACLSSGANLGTVKFSNPTNSKNKLRGRKYEEWELLGKDIEKRWGSVEVDTVPLYTLIAAAGLTEIDYFRFDAEGLELAILTDFPFHKIIFKLLIVDVSYLSRDEKGELNTLLLANDYSFVTDFARKDKVYVHNSVKESLNLRQFYQ